MAGSESALERFTIWRAKNSAEARWIPSRHRCGIADVYNSVVYTMDRCWSKPIVLTVVKKSEGCWMCSKLWEANKSGTNTRAFQRGVDERGATVLEQKRQLTHLPDEFLFSHFQTYLRSPLVYPNSSPVPTTRRRPRRMEARKLSIG